MTPERLSFALCNLRLKQAFNLSKASATEKTTLIVRYGNGIGEGSPSIHYGYPAEKIKSILETEMLKLPDHRSLKDISQFAESLPSLLNVGRCAIEMALLDFEAKRNQLPLYQFLSLPRPGKISSSFTVTTGNEKELKQQMEIAQQFDSIKVKVGFADDIKFIDQLMKMGDFKLRLDANGGWSVDTAIEKIKSLAGYPVEFVEQPITEPRLMELDKIKTKVDCKIFLDESIMLFSDIEKFAPAINGINIKLSRCGGLMTSVEMAHTAKRLNLKLLLGCMIETAIGITAALHLASLFDYFDLDSILLTENDPYWGAQFDGQEILLPDGYGIGINNEENTLA